MYYEILKYRFDNLFRKRIFFFIFKNNLFINDPTQARQEQKYIQLGRFLQTTQAAEPKQRQIIGNV